MRLAVLVFAALAIAPVHAQQPLAGASVSPYAVTPDNVVIEMLRMAGVKPGDVVVDLGSGDGRLVIAAAKDFGARAYGVDIDPNLVDYATRKAAEAGVSERAQFYLRDLFKTDVSDATVVTIYLLPGIMGRVAEKLRAELKPGARIVTHDYAFQDWPVDRVRVVDAPDKDNIGRRQATIYLFTVRPKT